MEHSLKINKYDDFYMSVAKLVADLSYALIKKVGCVIVEENRIISYGFNGMPSGFDNLCEIITIGGSMTTKHEVLHAESNAISKCAKSTESTQGAILYTTLSPCLECSKLIIQCGIIEVHYFEDYRDTAGLVLLRKANIKIIKHEK